MITILNDWFRNIELVTIWAKLCNFPAQFVDCSISGMTSATDMFLRAWVDFEPVWHFFRCRWPLLNSMILEVIPIKKEVIFHSPWFGILEILNYLKHWRRHRLDVFSALFATLGDFGFGWKRPLLLPSTTEKANALDSWLPTCGWARADKHGKTAGPMRAASSKAVGRVLWCPGWWRIWEDQL